MPIVLMLVALAALIVACLFGAFAVSLILGTVLTRSERGKRIAPLFLIVLPTSVIGAVVGGIGLGYLAYSLNESLIFLGPLGGVLLGGGVGLVLGAIVAVFWSTKVRKVSRNSERHGISVDGPQKS